MRDSIKIQKRKRNQQHQNIRKYAKNEKKGRVKKKNEKATKYDSVLTCASIRQR